MTRREFEFDLRPSKPKAHEIGALIIARAKDGRYGPNAKQPRSTLHR